MNINDFIAAVVASGAPGLDQLPEKRLAQVVLATLRTLGAQVDAAAEDEMVRVPALGSFTSRNVTTKDGRIVRRVQFRRAASKPKDVAPEAQ